MKSTTTPQKGNLIILLGIVVAAMSFGSMKENVSVKKMILKMDNASWFKESKSEISNTLLGLEKEPLPIVSIFSLTKLKK